MNSRTRILLSLLLLGLALGPCLIAGDGSDDDSSDDDSSDDDSSDDSDDSDNSSGQCDDLKNFDWEAARESWPECAQCEIWGVGVPCVREDKERPENCNGSGMRYCVDAHKAEICPEPCQLQNCEENSRVGTRHQFFHRHSAFYWEDLALAGHYDNVFVERDGMKICLSTCWRDPWEAECTDWVEYEGKNYCMNMNCEHDPNNRIVGCHRADTSSFDGPFHKPTCRECAKVFPTACGHVYNGPLDEPSQNWKELEPSP